jgi:hypothetical protein
MNKMYQEALNTYTLIVKNKQYPNVRREEGGKGRLRGNPPLLLSHTSLLQPSPPFPIFQPPYFSRPAASA